MRHRAERVGGTIDIVSVSKHGTTLTLTVVT
jgi:signal transduction histidine kinase